MFKQQLGAKLDYGFNRVRSDDNSLKFKLNYSRVNAQLVYDPTTAIGLPVQMGVVLHAGPGYSFVKPLGIYVENDLSFFNAMGGLEIHYEDMYAVSADGRRLKKWYGWLAPSDEIGFRGDVIPPLALDFEDDGPMYLEPTRTRPRCCKVETARP